MMVLNSFLLLFLLLHHLFQNHEITSNPLNSSNIPWRKPKFLLIQAVTDSYSQRNCHEWDYQKYPFTFQELSQINVMLYAKEHGYDYKYYHLDDLYFQNLAKQRGEGGEGEGEGEEEVIRDNYWIKPLAISAALHERINQQQQQEEEKDQLKEEDEQEEGYYDYVVYLDLDIIFITPEISLEEKILEWDSLYNPSTSTSPNNPTSPNTTPTTTPAFTISMSNAYIGSDLNNAHNYFPQYNSKDLSLVYNSGFIIFKNSLSTRQVISDWYHCPDVLTGCYRYKRGREYGSDQTAFTYLELFFNKNYHFKIQRLPCDEVNGFPDYFITRIPPSSGESSGEEGKETTNFGCHGKFVSHFWNLSGRYASSLIEERIIFKQFQRYIHQLIQQETQLFLSDEGRQLLNSTFLTTLTFQTGSDDCINCFVSMRIVLNEPLNLTWTIQENYIDNDLLTSIKDGCLQYHLQELASCEYMEEEINERIKKKYDSSKILQQEEISPNKNTNANTSLWQIHSKVLMIQVGFIGDNRSPQEWNRKKFPLSSSELSQFSVLNYANHHGYDYIFLNIDQNFLKANGINQLPLFALKTVLESISEDYETIIYVGLDIMILQLEKRIEEILSNWSNNWENVDIFTLKPEQDPRKDDKIGLNSINNSPFCIFRNPKKLSILNMKDDLSLSIMIIPIPPTPMDFMEVNSFLIYLPNFIPLQTSSLTSTIFLLQQYLTSKRDLPKNYGILSEVCSFPFSDKLILKLCIRTNNTGLEEELRLALTLDYPIDTHQPIEENYPNPEIYRDYEDFCRIYAMEKNVCDYVRLNINGIINHKYNFLLKAKKTCNNPTGTINNSSFITKAMFEEINTVGFSMNYSSLSSLFETPSIVFITAFKEEENNDKNNFNYTRSTNQTSIIEENHHQFSHLAYYLPSKYYLIIYLQWPSLVYLSKNYPELFLKTNLIFLNLDSIQENNNNNNNEISITWYSKIDILHKTWELFPNVTFYGWLDYNYLKSRRTPELLPSKDLNFQKLSTTHILFSFLLQFPAETWFSLCFPLKEGVDIAAVLGKFNC